MSVWNSKQYEFLD